MIKTIYWMDKGEEGGLLKVSYLLAIVEPHENLTFLSY